MSLRFRGYAVVALMVGVLAASAASGQTTWHVDAANCPGPGDGSEGNPFCQIQSGIAASVNGDTILVADGVYAGAGNKNLDFAGKRITLGSAGGDPTACIIDCQGSGRGFYFHTGETAAAAVQGLTIRNGSVTSSIPGESSGAGVYCSGASPTLTNCIITGNVAGHGSTAAYGGGLYCAAGAGPTLTNCVISDNAADCTSYYAYGGGVSCSSSSPTFIACVISGNTATSSSSYAYGGGVYFAASSPTLRSCRIVDNTALSAAGMYCTSSSPTMTNCVISGNQAFGTVGAVSCDSSSSPVLTNCTISGNSAAAYAGVYCAASTPRLTNCVLWGDSTPEIYVLSGTPTVTYSDVQGGYTGTGNINSEPGFSLTGDLYLAPGSPCLDAGTNTPVGGLPAQDADGNPRSLDGNGDGQAIADMGAYEFNPSVPTISVSPARTTYSFREGQPGQQTSTLSIRNAGGAVLHWTLSGGDSWLDAQPVQGESAGETNVVTLALTADAGTLLHGVYSTKLTITDDSASNHSRTVDVVVYVTRTMAVPSQFATIQAALNACVPGDEVVVASGTYGGSANKNLDFKGIAVTLRSATGNPEACFIDCQGSGRGFFFHSGETSDTVVDGFTIQNGNAAGFADDDGGGVYCSHSSPTLTNCIITGNRTNLGSGGGVYCYYYSSPTLTNCTISGNTAFYGGGFLSSAANPTLIGCTISENAGSNAGGVYCGFSPAPTFTDCRIIANTASSTSGGAGILCYNSSPTLTDCLVADNRCSYSGGGISCSSSNPQLNGCTIRGNTALSGGGLMCDSSSPMLANCTITGNAVSGTNAYGGGLYCRTSSNPTLTNCVISKNTADYGGGIRCDSTGLTLTNCVISRNTAFSDGGGVRYNSSGLRATNCIFWSDLPQEISVGTGSATITYCDVQGGAAGLGNVNSDPEFAFGDDFHLLPGSPCIDTGTNTPTGGLPGLDAEGNPRPVDGDGDALAVADMGIYEFGPALPAIALSPSRMVLVVPHGQVGTFPQALSIRNSSYGILHWGMTWNASWLQVDPAQGESGGEVLQLTVTVNADTLGMGEYSDMITVSDLDAPARHRTVEVVLQVTRILNVPQAYPTIQAAITAAGFKDTIVVANGTYTGTGNKNLDFAGKTVTLRSANDDPIACIIDCQNSGRGFYFHGGETADTVVSGFTIRNGHVSDTSSGGALGGGILCHQSSPTLLNCIIRSNSVSSSDIARGGGVYCDTYASPSFTNCVIDGNSLSGDIADGGGLSCFDHSNLLLTNCTIRGNTVSSSSSSATSIGGGITCAYYCNPILVNCVIAANVASSTGTACYGGGFYLSSNARPGIINCTIAKNQAASGGGLYSSSSLPRLTGCVVWGNTPGEIVASSGAPVVTYCNVEGGYTGTGNIDADPLFIDPDGPDNDPNTWQDNNYRLSSTSPCIDAANNAAVPSSVITDLDGLPRFVDDPATPDCPYAPGTCGEPPIADMGAFEYQPLPMLGDLNCDGVVDLDDVAPFVLALVDPAAYAVAYPNCELARADMDAGGTVDGCDVQAFVDVLLTP